MALFDFFSLRKLWSDWIAKNHLGLDSARRLSDQHQVLKACRFR